VKEKSFESPVMVTAESTGSFVTAAGISQLGENGT